MRREYDQNAYVVINTPGQATFDPAIKALFNLRNDLNTGNFTAISTQTSRRSTRAMDTILSARAEVGAKTNRLEAAQDRQSLLQVNLQDLRSKVQDTDITTAISQVLDSGDGLQRLAAGRQQVDPAESAGLPRSDSANDSSDQHDEHGGHSMSMTTTATRTIEIRTTRYGEMETVEISEDTILTFPEGVPGFERHRRFALIQDPKLAPFSWLQSLHDPLVGFLVIAPGLLVHDYEFDIADPDVELLGLDDASEASVLSILVVPEDVRAMTANLQAPLDHESTEAHREAGDPDGRAIPIEVPGVWWRWHLALRPSGDLGGDEHVSPESATRSEHPDRQGHRGRRPRVGRRTGPGGHPGTARDDGAPPRAAEAGRRGEPVSVHRNDGRLGRESRRGAGADRRAIERAARRRSRNGRGLPSHPRRRQPSSDVEPRKVRRARAA